MSVTRNNLTTLKSSPNVLLDSLISWLFPDLRDHALQPDKDFLVSQSIMVIGSNDVHQYKSAKDQGRRR